MAKHRLMWESGKVLKIERAILGGLLIAIVSVGVTAYYNAQIIGICQDKLRDVEKIKSEMDQVYGSMNISDEQVPTAESVERQVENYYSSLEEVDRECGRNNNDNQ